MEHNPTESVSELVWLYVKRRPFLKEVLRQGIVNHSALARKIASEVFLDESRTGAVKMALIRLSAKMGRSEEDLEGRILEVLRRSSMVIRSKVAVAIASQPIEGIEALSYAKSGRHITYILEQKDLERARKARAMVKVDENLNLIVIESPEELEDVPGVISHMLGALAMEGVNVVEFISCYTDTLLVIRASDTERAYAVLYRIMGI